MIFENFFIESGLYISKRSFSISPFTGGNPSSQCSCITISPFFEFSLSQSDATTDG